MYTSRNAAKYKFTTTANNWPLRYLDTESPFFYVDNFEEFKNGIQNLERETKSIKTCKSNLNKLNEKCDHAI